MIEAALMVWLLLVGFAALAIPTTGMRFTTRLALSFPVGVVVFLTFAWVQVVAGIPFAPTHPMAAATVAVVAGLVTVRGRLAAPTRRQAAVLAGAVVVTAGLALFFQAVPLARLSPDSIRYLTTAGVIAQTGSIETVRAFDVTHRQIVEALLFTPAHHTGLVYLPSVLPILGLSAIGAVVALIDEALPRHEIAWRERTLLLAAVVVLLLSSNRVVDNLFYVHGHMLTAVFVLLSVAGIWFALDTGRWGWLWLAVPSLVLLVAVRVEGFLVVVLILVPVLTRHDVPDRVRWLLVGAPVAAIVAWFGGVVAPLLADGGLNHAHGALAVALLLVALVPVSRWSLARRVAPYAPHLLVAGLVAVLAAFALRDPATLVDSARATVLNVLGRGGWRLTWVGLPALLVVALARTRLRHAEVWWTPVVGFAPLMFVLAYLREGAYRVGAGDSGNRMLMHVLLIAVVYLAVAVGRHHAEERRAGSPARATGAVP